MNRISLLAAAALLVAAGCSKAPAGESEIRVEASIGATKVISVGDVSVFEAGDRIAVYAWLGGATAVPDGRVVNGVVNTLGADGMWTPERPMRWKPQGVRHFFLGISPVQAAITDFLAAPFTLDPSAEAYAKSDLLVATHFGTDGSGVTPSAIPVPLAFDHVMARMVVNLQFRNEWDATPEVSGVTVTARTAAKVNYLAKTASADPSAAEAQVPLHPLSTPASGYALSYGGLQVPQAVRTVTVTIAGKQYVYQSPDDIALSGGRYTTLGLVVGRDRIELGDIAIAPWTSETLPDADAP